MIFNEPSKQEARSFLLDTYRRRYKLDYIPDQREYLTLCAQCVRGGRLIPGTELDQLLRAGFIRISQYHGVDIDKAIIDKNRKYSGPWWHHGDLYTILNEGCNPAVVHYDSMLGPKKAMSYTLRLMRLLAKQNDPVMLVTNVALQWTWSVKNSMRPRNFGDIVSSIMRDKKVFELFDQGWDPNVEYRPYAGLRDNMSQMGTLILFKE